MASLSAASLSSRRGALAPPASSVSSPRPQRSGAAGPFVAAPVVQRPLSSSSSSPKSPLRQLDGRDRSRRSLAARSLKADNATETDWRVKEMMDSVRTYFGVWSGKVRGRVKREEKGRD